MNNNDQGYVKLFRSIEKWEWYTDVNTTKLWIHCLIKANHRPMKWQGIIIETGQFVTSFAKLSKETGLSVKSVRVALNHLKTTNEVAHFGAREYSVITIIKWLDYQSFEDSKGTEEDTQDGKQGANQGQTKGKRGATNKNEKNIKNDKKKDIVAFIEFADGDAELLEALMMFDVMRDDIKKPMTDGAHKLLVTKLKKMRTDGEDITDCLKTSVMNSWQSVYPSKNKTQSNASGKGKRVEQITNYPVSNVESSEDSEKELEEAKRLFESLGN